MLDRVQVSRECRITMGLAPKWLATIRIRLTVEVPECISQVSTSLVYVDEPWKLMMRR